MPIRKAYIDTSDGQIHYRFCEGGSGLPILFFHMTASSSSSFENLIAALEGFCPLYAFDLPHYGQSFMPSAEPSYPYIADILMEAIDALGITKFHCFGHHGGTNVSAQLAADHPDRVASIMLAGVTYPTMEESARNSVFIYDNPPDIRGSQAITAWTRVVKDCDSSAPVEPDAPFFPVPAEVYHSELIDTLTAGTEWHWGYRAVFKHDMPKLLEKSLARSFWCAASVTSSSFGMSGRNRHCPTPRSSNERAMAVITARSPVMTWRPISKISSMIWTSESYFLAHSSCAHQLSSCERTAY